MFSVFFEYNQYYFLPGNQSTERSFHSLFNTEDECINYIEAQMISKKNPQDNVGKLIEYQYRQAGYGYMVITGIKKSKIVPGQHWGSHIKYSCQPLVLHNKKYSSRTMTLQEWEFRFVEKKDLDSVIDLFQELKRDFFNV
jgi:hypothetical protein